MFDGVFLYPRKTVPCLAVGVSATPTAVCRAGALMNIHRPLGTCKENNGFVTKSRRVKSPFSARFFDHFPSSECNDIDTQDDRKSQLFLEPRYESIG